MNNKISALIICAAAFMLAPVPGAVPAFGANDPEIVVDPPALVELWFSALGRVNRARFRRIIADDAKIVLKDLGIEQTKQEFIDALDAWENATRNANIIYRYTAIEDGSATALVCYVFKSNEVLNVETYTFNETQITGSVQEKKADNCDEIR